MVDHPKTLEFASPSSRSEARDQWEALMSQTIVPLAVDTDPEGPFYGKVTSGALAGPPDCSLMSITGSVQEFRRTARHIARSGDEYLLASIYTRGQARLHQDGRSAVVGAGDMVFYNTYHPCGWTNRSAFERLVVQVPLSLLRRQPGLARLELPTAVTVPADSPPGVVANFFCNLARVRQEAPHEAAVLETNALDLLASAVLLTAGARPVDTSAEALSREHIMTYLHDRFTDPDLSADEVARACHISRRTLFRIFDRAGDSFAATVKRLRMQHAETLLLRDPSLPPAAVAFASGFASERHFYRVFQQETAMTPGDYRHSRM